MGISPYYVGGSSNFWAMYDRKPQYVGGTIQLYSEEKDRGDIICHVLPESNIYSNHFLGMYSAYLTINKINEILGKISILKENTWKQENLKVVRNAIDQDFNEEILKNYLNNLMEPEEIEKKLRERDFKKYILID